MCGRFTLTVDAEQLILAFGLNGIPADWSPRFNIAPSQPVLGLRDAQTRRAEWLRWGLIPAWAKDSSIGHRLINARAETLDQKPAFRSAFASRRCLIQADGFYEWQASESKRSPSRPFLFRLKDGSPFTFAGLWDAWRNEGGETVLSCTIITCPANDLVAKIHDRMPVILDRTKCWVWLERREPSELKMLLKPYPAENMIAFAVGREVNNPALDSPVCVQPVARG